MYRERGCHTVEKEKSNTPSLFFYISIAEKGSVTKQVYEQIHEIQGIYLFIVKKLNKSGNWDSVSLIDENGSFRGEARFETKHLADQYIKLYKDRINKRLNAEGKSKTRLKLQVFEMNDKSMIEEKRKYGHYYHISASS